MTAYYSTDNGNVNDVGMWDVIETGSPLTWGDGNHTGHTFYANNHTIVCNVDFTVDEITTAAGAGTAGGGFSVTGTRTITANVVAGTSTCLTTSNTGYVLTINGNVTGGTASGCLGINPVSITATGSVVINGNVTGGGGGTADWQSFGIGRTGTSSSVSVSSDVVGGASAPGIQAGATSTVRVDGAIGATDSSIVAIAYYASYYTVDVRSTVVCSTDGLFPIAGSVTAGAKIKWYNPETEGLTISARDESGTERIFKVPDYPAEADVESTVEYDYGALEGSLEASGYTYGSEDASEVLTTATGAGTYIPVAVANVRAGTAVGVDPAVGTCEIPAASDVRFGEDVDDTTGTCYVPAAADVRFGTNVDATTGTAYIPAAADVEFGVDVDDTTGTFVVPAQADVWYGTGQYGAGGTEFTPAMRASDITVTGGTAATLTAPDIGKDIVVDDLTGTLDIPSTASIASAVVSAIKTDMGTDPTNYKVNLYEVKDVDAATALGDTDDFTAAMATAMQTDPTDFPVNVAEWLGVAPLALSSQRVQGVVPDTQKVDVNTIKTQTITCAAGITVGVYVGGTAAAATSVDVAAAKSVIDLINTDTGTGGAIQTALESIGGYVDCLPATWVTVPTTAQIKTAIEAAGGHLALILEDTGTTIPGTLTTIGNYVDCLPASWVVPATAAEVAAVQTHGDSTWATATSVTVSDKTGFSLSEAGNNAVADATLVRDVSNVEDAATLHSLGGIVLAATEFSRDGTTLTINKTDGETEFDTLTLSEDASSVAITGATE